MIRTFADRETERFFRLGKSKRVPPNVRNSTKQKLSLLDAATFLPDLASPPGNRLEKLHGDREGQHSIRINDQFRICFRWQDGDAYDVEVTDYHR